jgi:predicted enzyme related to lactoylglutathione lyase
MKRRSVTRDGNAGRWTMPNTFVHTELNTDDTSKAKKFYKGIFDWKLEDMKMGPGQVYTMIRSGKGGIGGLQKKPMAEAPTMWLSYVQVDDVSKTLAKAKKLGANVVVEKMEIPGMGFMGIFIDPTGAALGVWEPAKKRPARRAPAKRKARA